MDRARSRMILLAATLGVVFSPVLALRQAPAADPAPAQGPAPTSPASAPTPPAPAIAPTQPATNVTPPAVAITQPTTAPALPATTASSSIGVAPTQPATAPATQPGIATTAPAPQALATQPAATQAAAVLPAADGAAAATQPAEVAQIRMNFQNTPLDAILEHISRDAGFAIVKDAPVDARVTVISVQSLTASEAVMLLNTALKGEGLAAIQNGRTLHIVARAKAMKGNLPVHWGSDPSQIAVTEELITQVIPLHNVDAVKLRQDLTPLIGPDTDVTSNAGSNAILMTDTSANIKRIVEIVAILDKKEGTTSEIKIIQLKNASAPAVAKLILSVFHPPEPAQRKGEQPQPQPQRIEPERVLGSGVDQALKGGKVTAGADVRTNSVVIAAPSDTLKAIEAMVAEIDANPATATTPVIKSFHLKIADAMQVSRAIRITFNSGDDGAPNQSHQVASDETVHAHVTVVGEERTNTVIVTAPPGAMQVIEGLIKDIDAQPVVEAAVRSFHLQFADAAASAKVIMQVFLDPNTGLSRIQSTSRDKVMATADARTNTVFVTAPVDAMVLIEKTIKDLDGNPMNGSEVKFFHLKQADADAAAKLIIDFFKTPEGGVGERRPPDAVHYGVNAVADTRTNTVAVTAPPDAMKVVEQIVKEVETQATSVFDIESFTLKNGDATSTAKLLTSLFQPDPAAGAAPTGKGRGRESAIKAKVVAAADDRTNTVVVTAPAETLKIIENVIKLLDATPLTGAEIQVFQLMNADAGAAASLLDSIFQPSFQTVGSFGGGGGGGGGANGATPRPLGQLDAIRKLGWISTSSDSRTNTLIVTAPPETLKVVATIVKQIDGNPTSQQTFFMYRLRNGQAQNLELVLNELFGNIQLGGAGAANQRNGQQQQQQQAGGNNALGGGGISRGGGSSGLGSTSAAGGTGIGARRGTVSTGAGGGQAQQLSQGAQRVVTELTGQVFVVADPDTNSLLVTTATRFQKEVREIIAELDRPVPQVLIKVLVAEVTHDNSSDFGADFSILNTRPSGKGSIIGQSLGNAAAASNGGLVVSLVESNLNVTLHALATEGKLDVLSRPYILASDNQLASITVGQEVPFITDTRLTDTGQQINTIQYQDVGIILNVTPHINPEGLVILDVSPEISQLTGTTVPISAGVAAPVIAKRSASSRVGIKNGQTIVIGGMMQDQKTLTVSKVPILGDIPLIGEIFRRTITDKTKTELLIFLTPHVAQLPDTLEPMSKQETDGTRLTPTAVSPGTFEDHMKGMQRGNVRESNPTTQQAAPVIEFTQPTTQPTTGPGPSGTRPIALPGQ